MNVEEAIPRKADIVMHVLPEKPLDDKQIRNHQSNRARI
jgi:hypothetical protein